VKKALILLVLIFIPLVSAQYTYDLTLTVYRDGYVKVDYQIAPEDFASQIDVPLIGSHYEDLFITDENGNPLQYTLDKNHAVINVGGAQIVEISYYTPDLTAKEGLVWTLSIESYVPFKVILPNGSTVVDLSDIPLEISEGSITMPSGNQSVSYYLSSGTTIQTGSGSSNSSSIYMLGAIGLLIVAAIFIGMKLMRGEKKKPINREAFLKKMERFDLNDDERRALLYILDKGGRASQAEVRNTLGIPKTTAWRMFNRLENYGLVKIVKGAKENWVELKP